MRSNARVLLVAFSLAIMIFPVLTAQAFNSDVQTIVFVYPEKVIVQVNATFQVFVNVSAVSKLQGFDFMLAYDKRVLNCLNLEEGTFLSGFGSTFVAKLEINNSLTCNRGRVWLAACILGKGFADGNGTLAVVTFKAVSLGETVLDLYSDYPLRQDAVKLTTCISQPIPNKAVDGFVTVVAAGSSTYGASPPPTGSSDPPNDPANDPLSADVNGDGYVDIRDVAIVALAFATVKGDLKYNAKADLDQNGIVNICDVALVAREVYQSNRM